MEKIIRETFLDELEIQLLEQATKEMFRILNKFSFDYGMDLSPDHKIKITTSFFMQFISDDVIRDSDRTRKEWEKNVNDISAYFIFNLIHHVFLHFYFFEKHVIFGIIFFYQHFRDHTEKFSPPFRIRRYFFFSFCAWSKGYV